MATIPIRLEDLLPQLDRVKPCGDGYTASCPAHGDMRGSALFVQQQSESHSEVICREGCPSSAILAALEIPQVESRGASIESDETAETQLEEPCLVADLSAPVHGPHVPSLSSSTQATLSVERIKASEKVKPRRTISEPLVEEYIQAYRTGAPMPPIEGYEDTKGTVWLADGWHRLEAQRRLNVSQIEVIVHAGDQADAMLHAAQANVTHGWRREPGDAVVAASVAIHGLSLKRPEKRPTHREVMEAARVGKETVVKAFAALDAAGIGVGAKDPRGGARRRFGTGSTKHHTAGDQPEATIGPEDATSKPPAIDRETAEVVDDPRDAVRVENGGEASDIALHRASTPNTSTFPPTDNAANRDHETDLESLADAIKRVHDRVEDLVTHDAEHVATYIDPNSKGLLEKTVDQLTAWAMQVDAAGPTLLPSVRARPRRSTSAQESSELRARAL